MEKLNKSFSKLTNKDEEYELLKKFCQALTEYLAKIKKEENDKSKYEIQINCAEDIQTQSSIEFFTFDKVKFNDYYIGYKNGYLDDKLLIFTINFEAKQEKDIETIKKGFSVIVSKIKKENKDYNVKFKLYFRSKGKLVYIDFLFQNVEIIKILLELGINLNEYDQFHCSINSEFKISKLLDNYDLKNFLYDLFKLKFSLKSTRNNANYLINAIKDAVKILKLEDKQLLESIQAMILVFNLGKALSKINIDLKSKVIIDEIYNYFDFQIEKEKKFNDEQENNKKFLKSIKDMKEKCKTFKQDLISEGLFYPAKSINIDKISFYFGIPKYKSGISLICKINGLTKFES